MPQATGAEKSFTYTGFGDFIHGTHHAIINYTVTSSNTHTTVTISSIQEYIDSAVAIHGGSADITATGVLSASGYSNSSYTATITARKGKSATFATSITRQWARGTSAQTKYVSLTTNFSGSTHGEDSVASIPVTVPALASYAVTYTANGGSGAPANQTKYYGIDLKLSAVEPTKSGYTFKGWATSEANAKAGNATVSPGATYSSNAVLSLWAVWELTYNKPAISGLSIERCRSDGTLDDEGSYAKATFDWAVFRSALSRYYGGSGAPYSDNSVSACTITITDGIITKTAAPTLAGASGTESVVVGDGTFNIDDQYNVTITITDSQSVYPDHTTTLLGVLPKAAFPMDVNATGTAVGFLMPAPDNAEGIFFGEDIKITLPKYQTSGESDKNIYDAIVAKGWSSYVLDGNIISLKKLLEKMLS